MSAESRTPSDPHNPGWWYDVSPLNGPECPMCHRDDWSHTLGCPVEWYYREWKRLFAERAEQNVERLLG